MNKSSILFLGALIAMGMVACDDKLPVAPPQANEQGPVLEGFAGATASLSMNSVDLKAELESGAEYISLYTVNAGSSGLSQSDIWGELEISNSADFSQSIILSEYEGIVGTVSLNELYESHAQLFGIAPYAQTVYYRIPLYANVDGNTYRIGSVGSYGSTGTFTESNYEPGFEIEETYYIIGVKGWDPSDCVALSHSDKSAYDDPNFTYEFESEGATYWKIVPPDVYDQVGTAGFDAGSDFWPNIYSVYAYDDNKYAGTLKIADGPSGEIPAGSWTITVNMKDLTYEVSGVPAGMPDWIGTPNTSQDWNIGSSMKLMPYGDYYKGFSFFGGEWGGKLAYSAGGSDIWIGLVGGTLEEKTDDGTYYEMVLEENGGGNIFEGSLAQMYFISYSYPDKFAKFYPIVSCGLIGGFNDWGSQEPMDVVEGSGDMKWTGTYTFDSDTEFKFRFNDTWTINLGGDLNNLSVDGSNIAVSAGTYEITLDISNVPYTATISAK